MARAPRWGVVSTIKAPVDQVAAFAAHHLDLGAHRIWLHFDDPDDPAAALMAGQDHITVVRCDAAYWGALCGKRPDTHQERQVRNATRIARKARVDWVGHFDVDEYLAASVPVADLLADQPPDRLLIRIEPWEALHDPVLPPDVFTARAFRRQVPEESDALLRLLYGPYGEALDRGMLSHAAGKCLFRVGVRDLVIRIHTARLRGEPVSGGRFHPDLALLHFHAQDPAEWKARLQFRLKSGAYRTKWELQALLLDADAAAVNAFYTAVQMARPDLLRHLSAHGMLREADLGLRARAQERFPVAI